MPRSAATFAEVGVEAAEALATAMGLSTSHETQRRFAAGSRCFVALVEGVIVAYSWLSRDLERIGELERAMRMRPDEAYIWDCATLAPFRRQGIYSALLAHVAARLRSEGIRRVWIGASLRNHPSLKGFVHAGFQPALTVIYLRALRFSHSWVCGASGAPARLIADARWALVIDKGARATTQAGERVRDQGSLPHGGTA
jgi:GNAT superfamily N-acetyltransferase